MYYDKIGLFRRMLDISREMNLPRAFKTDVTKHDRNAVMEMEADRHGGGTWYWILRDSGSHFFSVKDTEVIRSALRQCNVRAVFRIDGVFGDFDINEIPAGLFFGRQS